MWYQVASRRPGISFQYWEQGDMVGHDLAANEPWIAIANGQGFSDLGLVASAGPWMIDTRDKSLRVLDVARMRYVKFTELSQVAPQQSPVQMLSEDPGTYHLSLRLKASLPAALVNSRVPGFGLQPLPSAPPFLTIHSFERVAPTVCGHVIRDLTGRRSTQQLLGIESQLTFVNHVLAQAITGTSGWSADYNIPFMNPPREVTITEDIGYPVKPRHGASTVFEVLKKYKDRESNVNVFWIWAYQSNTSDPGIGVDPRERMIVIHDGLPRQEQQLAKAFARLFGVTRKDIFLNENMRLRLDDIRTINDTAAKMSAPN